MKFVRWSAVGLAAALILTIALFLRPPTPSQGVDTTLSETASAARATIEQNAARPSALPGPTDTAIPHAAAGRLVVAAQAWTLTSPTEGTSLTETASARQIARLRDDTLKGQSAVISPATLATLSGLRENDGVQIPLLGGDSTVGRVQLIEREADGIVRVAGRLTGDRPGTFLLAHNGKTAAGHVILEAAGVALDIVRERDGKTWLIEKSVSDLLCAPLGRPRFDPRPAGPDEFSGIADVPPILSSRPSATAVVYLDFDGAVVTDSSWNGGATINAQPSTLTAAEMTEVWNRVREDFRPFNLDITTDPARYASAPVTRRTRCIITPTDIASPGAGGVARLFSFSQAGTTGLSTTVPCWVFNSTVKGIAEAISHEVGHTLGLQHDGRTSPVEDYYEGHGTGAVGWAPIMGSSYYHELTQWSKGEYANANRFEDDVAIIASSLNGFGYIGDEAGGTRQSAVNLSSANGTVAQAGVISQANDIDFFAMNVAAGRIVLNAAPFTTSPNLDLAIELQDAAGTVLASSNPDTELFASINVSVPAGTYYLRVQGTGRGDVLGLGYSSYGSIGAYTITGSLPGAAQAPVFTSLGTASGVVGQPFSFQLTAANTPTSFSVLAGVMPAGLTLDALTGLISGTPTTAGTSTLTFGAGNAIGTGSRLVTLTFSSAVTLAEALDNAQLTWTHAGNKAWFAQTAVSSDGNGAVQSGAIGHGQSSRLRTTAAGPANVSFKWKVDSEAGYDFVQFLVDNVVVASRSGQIAWETRNANLTAGTHTLEWRYSKDGNVSEGEDAAWVDAIVLSEPLPPVITSPAALSGTVGQSFSYQVVATNSPTRYSILSGALPAGLSLATATGVISGIPTQAQVSHVTLGAINQAGTGELPMVISISPNDLALDLALDTSGLTWTTGGNAPWSGQATITYDHIDAARSGTIGNNQSSWMETTVTGPAVVSFFWRVDSEEGYDYLRLFDNGTLKAAISGFRDWAPFTLSVGPGSHTLRWAYTKDVTKAVGDDAGWVDTVTVSNTLTRIITLGGDMAFGPVAVGSSLSKTLLVANTGNSPLTLTGIELPAGFSGSAEGEVAPGSFRNITLTFTPTAAADYSGTLRISSDATEGTSTRAISGTGTPPPPVNDSFLDAVVITGSTLRVTGNTVSASRETGEPAHAGMPGKRSIWWRWVAPTTGTVAVNTIGSSFDTLLGVYQGTGLTALTMVASDDEDGGGGTSSLVFNAIAGTTYFIAVDGYLGDSGDVVLNLATVPLIAPNDNFENATVLTGANAQSVASNVTANRQSSEPKHLNQVSGRSIWWSWTAPFTGRLLLDTNGSHFDTTLAVYTGSSLATLTLVGSNDNGGYLTNSALSLAVTAGVTYQIVVEGSKNTAGVAVLNLRLVVPPPNDNLANAQLLTGVMPRAAGTNVGASKEPGEPNHAIVPGGSSVWYRWLAPQTGRVRVSTAGSRFDTIVAVYTPNASNLLVGIAANDNENYFTATSATSFTATANVGYWITVEGYAGAEGTLALSLDYLTPPANDSFNSPLTLSGTNIQTSANNTGAIKEPGEPNHAGYFGGCSIWWQWTAPANARVTLSTAGSSIDTLLAVYRGNAINALTLVAQNDEDATGTGTSALTFTATAGTTYRIAVDGYAAETGPIALRLSAVVLSAPVITTQPASKTVTAGQNVTFSVAASGTAPLLYQWRFNGTPLSGATGATLNLTNAPVTSSGAYTVVVTNSVGSVTSSPAILTVTPAPTAPSITTHPVSKSATIGQSVTFSVVANGTGPLSYQWFENALPIPGATSASFTLASAQLTNNAAYRVVVTNSLGSATSNPATLTVTRPPPDLAIIGKSPNQIINVGQTVTLSVTATSSLPISYQWYRPAQIEDGAIIPGATGPTLILTNVTWADSGYYRVAVRDSTGTVLNTSIAVTVNPPPMAVAIVTQPVSQSAHVGQSVTFSVVATGTGPLGYQWRKQGVAIPGATSANFTLPAVQLSDAGNYTVSVSNLIGPVISETAVLTVTPTPSSQITNVSVRTTLAANQIVIVGLTVADGSRDTLIRAVGPGLAPYVDSGTMPDPTMSVFSGSMLIQSNDNWGGSTDLAQSFASVGAFPLSPTSLDAALIHTTSSSRSIHVTGPTGGEVLVEAYAMPASGSARLTNISARNRVGAGGDTLIAGFVIAGDVPKTVLIRGVGPGLVPFTVTDPLVDPKLEVYHGSTLVAENDDWSPSLAATFSSVGAFSLPANSKDAAIQITLQPGSYTVQVKSADGSAGEALVELYEVTP